VVVVVLYMTQLVKMVVLVEEVLLIMAQHILEVLGVKGMEVVPHIMDKVLVVVVEVWAQLVEILLRM
jgi:hypothetical protein